MKYVKNKDCEKDIFTGELIKITFVGGAKHINDLVASGLLLETRRLQTY